MTGVKEVKEVKEVRTPSLTLPLVKGEGTRLSALRLMRGAVTAIAAVASSLPSLVFKEALKVDHQ